VFQVGPSNSAYPLTVSGKNGNAGDALDGSAREETSNGMKFSAWDADNDLSNKNCALEYEG
jgi:hypothetical protein